MKLKSKPIKKLRIAIVGSREFGNLKLVENFVKHLPENCLIVSGGANGVDKCAENIASMCSVPTKIYKPDWKTLGKAAGFIRNEKIVDDCDICVAFWDLKSHGTLNSINWAKKKNKLLIVIDEDGTIKFNHKILLSPVED